MTRPRRPAGGGPARFEAASPEASRSRGTDSDPPGAGVWEHETWLDRSDWEDIEALLAGPCPGAESLRAAVTILRAMAYEPVVAVGRVVNPLLELWAAGRVVGGGAAVPAEALLAVLPARKMIGAPELVSVCDQTMRALESRDVRCPADPGSGIE